MNKLLDVTSKLFCLVLCVILFMVLFFYVSINIFNKIVTKDNIRVIVSSYDINDILSDELDDILEPLYETADVNEIDRTVIDGLINDIEFKELIGNHYGNFAESLFYNKDIKNITSDDIVNVFTSIISKKEVELGYNLTNEEKNIILKLVEENAAKIVDIIPSYGELTIKLTTKDIKSIQFLFSKNIQNILVVVMVIITIVIALFRWSIYKFAIWTGVTTASMGAIFIAISSSFRSMLETSLPTYFVPSMFDMLNTSVFGLITNVGSTLTAVGVVQIVYYFIIKASNKDVKI